MSNDSGYAHLGQIRRLVIHHSASKLSTTVDDIRRWHVEERGWSDIGYHGVITSDGHYHAARPIWERGAHIKKLNTGSIGICAVGDNTRPTHRWTLAQLWQLVVQIRIWQRLVPGITWAGHRDFTATKDGKPTTLCPGVSVRELFEDIIVSPQIDRDMLVVT